MTAENRAFLELHIAVFLFGFTAILGDLIQLEASWLVWWRVLITSLSLILFINLRQKIGALSRQDILKFMGIGTLVGLHWVAFYGAIKLANASIAVLCMATTSLFTSILEPMISKNRIKKYQMMLGIIIIPGMAFILRDLSFDLRAGFFVGILAAFLATLFSIFNKLLINKTDELTMTFIELGSAWLFLSIVIPIYHLVIQEPINLFPKSIEDWGYILILSLLCTTLAYVLSLRALKYLSAFASNLTINMEPIYGILLAWVLLSDNKELSPSFYIGVLIIFLTVFSYPLIRKKYNLN